MATISESGTGHHFPLVFSYFFNVCLFSLVSPFYVTRNKQGPSSSSMEIKSLLPHKILCGLIQLLGCISYLLFLRKLMTFTDIITAPEMMYDLCRMLWVAMYAFLLQYCLWFRQPSVKALLYTAVTPNPNKTKLRLMKLFMWVAIFANIGYMFLDSYHRAHDSMDEWLDDLVQQALPAFFIDNHDGGIGLHDISLPLQILTLLYSFTIYYMGSVSFLACLLVFISAFAVYEVVVITGRAVGNVPSNNLKEKVLLYIRMKGQIATINSICGPILVAVFIDLLGFCASSLGRPDTSPWYIQLFLWMTYGIDLVALVIAAEANSQAVTLENTLVSNFMTEDEHWASSVREVQGVKAVLKTSSGQNGLTGWKFFTVSYTFLGTVTSVCFTYALVMLQFVATPKSSTVCNCTR